ncbi:SDR family NAD(P)-dependent oxidoreductase [Tabrizicola sp.]|uniref:SDR family NAD(P)-dependent oxidoreductase n=1 Tax=Tabrizicola sp. TaxID=2005166 RepID=UPI003F325026
MARIALVTGVGKETGLGFAVAAELARRGDRVWIAARTLAQAEAMVQAVGGDTVPVALDLSDRSAVADLAGRVQKDEGRLDVLINNAAAVAPWGETAAGADLEVARGVMDVTLFGTWAMCEAFLPLLRVAPAGRLVNVSSGAGSHGDQAFGLTTANGMGTSYAVAKAALNALTAKLAREEASAVKINAVCPGFTATFPGGSEMGARPVAEGAASILWAADLPNDGPTGGFFRDGKPLPW